MAGPGMLSLSRTQKYCTKLADEIMKLRGEKALMDFKICIRDDTIPCSKFIMAAHSPMLRAMLTSDMAEVAKQEIRLDHIDKGIIQIILDYMYCENVNFHKDQLMALISAADYLQMTELKEVCLDEVPGILDHTNAISWWKEAGNMNFDDIRDRCVRIMTEEFDQVSQQTDFLKLDLTEVQEYIINICSRTVDSDLILDAVMRWVGHNEAHVPLLEDLLHKIKLDKCSVEGIKAVMKFHEGLLDETLIVYKLLLNMMAEISTDNPKAASRNLVVVGGHVDENAVNHQCWEVNEPGIENVFDVPSSNLTCRTSICQIPQGFAITGGDNSDLCFIFIATLKSWFKLQDMLAHRRCHNSVCFRNTLYVMGGLVGTYVKGMKPSDSVDFLVMESGDWKKGPSMPLSVKFPKVSNIDDHVYLLDEESLQLLCLDIDEEVWHKLAPLPVNGTCIGISLTSAHGLLFAAGGYKRICAWYRPATDTWSTGQQPVQKHNFGAFTYHNDKLLLLGGSFSNGTDEVEEYDIEEDKWSMCSYKMPKKIYNHHAFLLDMQPRD